MSAPQNEIDISKYSPVELVGLKVKKLEAELSTLKEQLRLTKEMLGAAKRIELDDGSVLRSRPIHGEILWAACNEHGAVVGNYFHVLEAYAAIKPVQNPVENNNP